MAETQMELPIASAVAPVAEAVDEPPKKQRKKRAKKDAKKAGKKTAKKAGKKAAKKTAKKAGKKAAKKAAKAPRRKKAAKRRPTRQSCTAVVHVGPTTSLELAAWDELSRAERRRNLMIVGAVAVVTAGAILLYSKRAKAALPPGKGAEDDEVIDTDTDEVIDTDTDEVIEDTDEAADAADEEVEDNEIDVNVEIGKTALPPPIKLGTIPALYTRVYQLFDRFVEGGMEFFANLGDSEAGNNIFAVNPAGVSLSKGSIERQMKSSTYGKPWNGKGKVPYTAYLEPEKAKQLGAIGLFQGIAGTLGQAGRRNGTAICAPLPTSTWMDPANQLAGFMELFGALYHEFGATTPVAMRIAWGYPSKANKTNDPYYIDRSEKWEKRQAKTGVTANGFSNMVLRDHSVEEVYAYFKQFNYGEIVDAARNAPRMSPMVTPLSVSALARFQAQMDEHPAIIGNDLT